MRAPVLDIFSDVSVSTVHAHMLRRGSYRLDASFYDPRSTSARHTLATSGLTTELLGESADVFCSTIRGRTFVSPNNGVALLGGHNLDTDDDQDTKYVSSLLTRNIDRERLERGDVLLSSAGTVGIFDFVWKNHEQKLASQHIIRTRAKTGRVLPGYLYAYLSSPLALAMVTNQPAGSVIVTLYTEHLEQLPLPRLAAQLEGRIHDLVIRSFENRNDYRTLLQWARLAAMACNSLDPLPKETQEDPVLIRVAASDALTGEKRLNAHFYNPTARAAVAGVRQCREVKTVGEVAKVMFTGGRLKRNYVESDHGVPFLSGKNTVQIRPTDLKHLSNMQMADLPELVLKRASTLITRSGTIGRTCFVWQNYEDWAGSEHILRVLPDESEIDPGYLYAFLSSSYGYEQILRYRHGSVIDEITDKQIEQVLVPVPSRKEQTAIGNKVREAYEKRAEAVRLEDEAQGILMKELTGTQGI